MSRVLVGLMVFVGACGGKQTTSQNVTESSERPSGWDFDPKTVASIELSAEENVLCAGTRLAIKVKATDRSGTPVESGLQTAMPDPMSDFDGQLPATVTVQTTPETPEAECSGGTCWVRSPLPRLPAGIGKEVVVSIGIPGAPAKPGTLTLKQSFCDDKGAAIILSAQDGKRGRDGDSGRGNGDPGQSGEDGAPGGDAPPNSVEAAFVSTEGFPKLLLVIGGDDEKPDVALGGPGQKVKVIARGAMGGTGGNGGRGGASTGGACMPGKGGNGGNGGKGGNGAELTVRTPSREVYDSLAIDVGGASGGFAGDYGKGGDCGEGYSAADGDKGDNGASGEYGDLEAKTVPVAKLSRITKWLQANPQFQLAK